MADISVAGVSVRTSSQDAPTTARNTETMRTNHGRVSDSKATASTKSISSKAHRAYSREDVEAFLVLLDLHGIALRAGCRADRGVDPLIQSIAGRPRFGCRGVESVVDAGLAPTVVVHDRRGRWHLPNRRKRRDRRHPRVRVNAEPPQVLQPVRFATVHPFHEHRYLPARGQHVETRAHSALTGEPQVRQHFIDGEFERLEPPRIGLHPDLFAAPGRGLPRPIHQVDDFEAHHEVVGQALEYPTFGAGDHDLVRPPTEECTGIVLVAAPPTAFLPGSRHVDPLDPFRGLVDHLPNPGHR